MNLIKSHWLLALVKLLDIINFRAINARVVRKEYSRVRIEEARSKWEKIRAERYQCILKSETLDLGRGSKP